MSGDLPRGIVGVIRTSRTDHALTLARGWLLAGVPGVEVTLTVPDAESVLAAVAAEGGDRIGAGTVLDPTRVASCVAAGAAYIVAPDSSPEVIRQCLEHGVPAVPGTLTPTEMSAAMRMGASAVKVFPISGVGGPAFVRSVLEPMPTLRVVASGGITADQVPDYLDAGVWSVCLGREIVDPRAVDDGDVRGVAAYAARILGRAGVAPAFG